jgi:hypothetical protein
MGRVEIDRPATLNYSRKWAKIRTEALARRVLGDAWKIATGWNQVTGNTRSSIRMLPTTYPSTYKVVTKVGSKHRNALLLHQGSPAHLIRPRLKGGLLFYSTVHGRKICFKGTVKHPGFAGWKYLTKPLLKHGPRHGFKVLIARRPN